MDLGLLLNKLQKVKRHPNNEYSCRCPVHDDKRESLNIKQAEDGKLLICCHAGCDTKDIVKAIGITMEDLFPEKEKPINGKLYSAEDIKNWPWTEQVYLYNNKENLPHMLVVRMKNKDFRQYTHVIDGKYKAGLNGKKTIPYRLPEITQEIKNNLVIFMTEGEKDADNIVKKLKLPATTIPGGAGVGWKDSYNSSFKDAKIVLLPDNDKPGRELMQKIANRLSTVVKELRILNLPNLPDKGDISDWIDAGGTREQLIELVRKTGKYEVIPEGINLNFYTDTWNGEQLVKRHGENIRYCAKWKSWILWNKKRWEEDESIKIQAMAKDTIKNFHKLIGKIEDEKERDQFINHIKSSESMTKRRYMVEAAMSEPGMPVMPNIFDNNKWLLNLNNGTLDLKSMKLKEHKREDYITKIIDSNYNPEAKCETWIKFLERIFEGNKELINFVQRVIGYSLTGLTVEQCIFILYGSGSNGKSTFINIIKEILCDYGQQTPSETLMEKKNSGGVTNDLARLRGARFVASVETEQGKCFAESLVKQLSGDDTITARFLHKEFFEFIPECKIFIATNHKPKIKNTDHAIWRRIKLIPFTVTIPEEEKDLDFMDKLRKEKEGILAWAIEGCKQWQAEGLKTPEEVIGATQLYKEEMDVIGAFIDECCIIGEQYKSLAKDIYDTYVKWCEENGEYTISQRAFGLKLTDRGFKREKVFSGYNRGKFQYNGIGILDAVPDSDLN